MPRKESSEKVRRKPCFGSRHMDFEDCTEECEDAKECLAIRFKMLQGR